MNSVNTGSVSSWTETLPAYCLDGEGNVRYQAVGGVQGKGIKRKLKRSGEDGEAPRARVFKWKKERKK